MGEVAPIRQAWEAPEEPMTAESGPPAFETFFEDEKERLLRALYLITGSAGEAEDLAQEAFTRLYERWDAVSVMDDPAGYLHRTAMNVFRNQARRAKVALRRAVGLGPDQDVFERVDDRDVATRALASLTPRQRAALVLTEGLGYSGEDAGRLLGIKAGTVWALTHQARTSLRGTVEAIDG
jgi:RNA polymerase sigma factor (sigma-70 family)